MGNSQLPTEIAVVVEGSSGKGGKERGRGVFGVSARGLLFGVFFV